MPDCNLFPAGPARDPAPATFRYGCWLAGALLLCGCVHLGPGAGGCLGDFDCKLDRVCAEGRCVWPQGGSAASPSGPAPAQPAETTKGGGATVEPDRNAPPAGSAPGYTMFRLEPRHRGRSAFKLPARRPDILWAYETRGAVTSSPAILKDGTIIVGSHDRRVHVIGSGGEARWTFSAGDLIFGSPAVTAAGLVLVGSDDDHLYALDVAAKKEAWRFRVGNCSTRVGVGPEASRCDADGGPTVGPDGTIYLGGDGIYALRPDGTVRWRFATGGHVSTAPALLADGTVVAGCQDNLIYAVGPDGTKRWEFRAGDDVESSPAIGDDGTIYVGSDDQKLYALTPAGTLRWAFTAGDDIRASPALAADGTVYVGAFDGLLYAIRPDGTLVWSFRTGDRILSSALVDAEGSLVFGSQDDRLYALEKTGHLRWSVEVGGDIDSSPVLAPDGTIFVGADDRRLYALR